MKYAQVDRSKDPIEVVGYYDTDALHYPNLPDDLVPLGDECWERRMSHLRWTVVDGKLEALPAPTHNVAGVRMIEAKAALAASDIIVLRCYEASKKVPKPWVDYRAALRQIIRGDDGPLPEKPAPLGF